MKTVMVAHRGAQHIAPENTVRAFQLAIKNGFKAVECDVQLTRDGHLVVIHDETVDRTTNGSGWVSQLTKAELDQLEVAGGDRIPTLHQVFYEVVVKSKRKLIIEIKADTKFHARQVAIRLASFVKHIGTQYRRYIEVHSFWYSALEQFKRECPHIITSAIINGGFNSQEIIAIARSARSDGVSVGYEFLSPKIVRDCHTCKLFVDTWAISDKTVLHRLRPFGINAIVENFTGIVL